MTIRELLGELAERVGLGEAALEDEGGVQIVLDDDRVIEIHANDDRPGVTFSSAVGPAPTEDREAVLATLLEANLMGEGTFGAALCLDSAAGEIVLCRSINVDDMPYDAFEAELSQFSAAQLAWQELLEDGGRPDGLGDDDTAAQDPSPDAGMVRV